MTRHRSDVAVRRAVATMTTAAMMFSLTGLDPVGAAGAAPATDPAAASSSDASDFSAARADVADRLLVRWDESATPAVRDAVLAAALAEGVLSDPDARRVTGDVDAVRVRGPIDGARSVLEFSEHVLFAEPDRIVSVPAAAVQAARPTDALFEQQWGLENTGQLIRRDPDAPIAGVAGVDVRAREAWATTRGDEDVVVAVIDTGVDPAHPDLDGAVVERFSTIEDASGDTDHGTSVASVIAARSDDGFGMAGLAPQTSILSIAAFTTTNDAPTSTMTSILLAFDLAIEAGADVINASWVTPDDSRALRDAVASAGVPVVAATGNDPRVLVPGGALYPAGWDLANLVSVTSIDPDGEISAFANTGPEVVDVAAPGSSIVAAFPAEVEGGTPRHGYADGTSYAAPFVTGALALAIAAAPYATASELVDAVSWTSGFRPELRDATITGGLLDAAALIRGTSRPICRPDSHTTAGFVDVAGGNLHADGIDCVTAVGVATGRTESLFAPSTPVTRAQAASFLYRIIERAGGVPSHDSDGDTTQGSDGDGATGDDTDTSTGDDADTSAGDDADGSTGDDTDGSDTVAFDDVPPSSAHHDAIHALAEVGIVRGDGEGHFRPLQPVTRAHLSTFLVRTHEALTAIQQPPSRRWFDDIAANTHVNEIDRARDLGLVKGVGTRVFDPTSATRRDQAASLLARLLDALARDGVGLS